jgi:tetrahydromethanopterin S-methyltransferase subunit G
MHATVCLLPFDCDMQVAYSNLAEQQPDTALPSDSAAQQQQPSQAAAAPQQQQGSSGPAQGQHSSNFDKLLDRVVQAELKAELATLDMKLKAELVSKQDLKDCEQRADSRFDRIEKQFDKIDSRFDKIDSRFDKIESQLGWGFGVLIGLYVMVVGLSPPVVELVGKLTSQAKVPSL